MERKIKWKIPSVHHVYDFNFDPYFIQPSTLITTNEMIAKRYDLNERNENNERF